MNVHVERPRFVRARAPLRLGLAGGGTDVSPFCDDHGGCVLNATIDLYAYATLELLDEPVLVFEAADNGHRHHGPASLDEPSDARLALHHGVYRHIVQRYCNGHPFGARLVTHSDAPPGSGLGSSSTLVVVMIQAFVEALNLPLGEYEVAHLAYEIERVELALAGGKQDQYAAAFGGVNFIEFGANGHVLVNPLRVKPWIMSELEASLVLFYTGVSRSSAAIIEEQVRNVRNHDPSSTDAFMGLKREAVYMKEALLRGDFPAFVDGMSKSWDAKKRTAKCVSSDEIDQALSLAREAGALAGKVSGAGGGGFIMFFVDPMLKPKVVGALSAREGRVFNCHFTKEGSQSWSIR